MPPSKAKTSSAKTAHWLEGLDSGEPEYAPKPVQKRRALLIGVNSYQQLTPLQYAVQDVKAIKDALEGFLYEDIQILHDEAGAKKKPTYKNVLRELEAFVGRAGRDDLLLVYFAGHGKMRDDKPWLLLSDSKWNGKKQWYDQALSVEKVKSLLRQGASERLVLMLDACQTGEAGERDAVGPRERARFIRRAYEEARGIVVFASSSPGQKAQELKELGHGVFTHYVLEGLADKSLVDKSTQLLTVTRLAAHVTQRLSRWKKKSIYVQMPRLQVDGMDLALVDHSQAGIWKPENRPLPPLRELQRLEGHEKGKTIGHIILSPKGSRLLTVSEDGTARLWNAKTGKREGRPYRHPSPVWQASLSADGKHFATLDADGVARLWRIGAARFTYEIRPSSTPYYSLAFTPDGRSLALGEDFQVTFYAIDRDEWGVSAFGHEGPVKAIAFLGSHGLMATGSFDGTAILRDLTTKQVIRSHPRVEGEAGWILQVALSPDGRFLATGGQDPDLMVQAPDGSWVRNGPAPDSVPLQHVPHVWSNATGKLLYSIREHSKSVTVVQFSPGGHFLLTASRDGTARVWRASNGRLLQTLDGPRVAIMAGTFSADGTRIILGYEDGSIRIFGPEAESTPSKRRGKS